MANYAVVDGTHLQMTLNKAHNVPATVAIGGLCGYGLEQTVDTAAGIRQVFPVVGSYSATGLYYAGGGTAIVGRMGQSSAFLNVTLNVASIARNGNVVTVTTAGNLPVDVNGLTLTVSGVADSSYNGSYVVTTTGPHTLTYAQSGANSTSTGGTLAVLTGGYALYPMAEVLSVLNPATKSVDGQMTLAPNTVAWAVNDAVEQPHYFQEAVGGDLTFVGQTTPRPASFMRAGMQYEGNNGPGLQGFTVTNATPATEYLGNGGTHTAPDLAYEAKGVWQRTMVADAGEQSMFTIHCNSHGCGKWNSGYNLFELDSAVSADIVSYQPMTSALTMTMRGTPYQFTPQGFTAGTVNAGTVNATTLNGALSGANITSGTVSAARLPVFGGSGNGHAEGTVPDPGATTGTTRYLREDGTWAAPPVSSSGSTALGTTVGAGTGLSVGVTADYNFLQGSGSVLTDNSGNGNDGTLGSGSLAPTWTSTGLVFANQQNVLLPSALNGTKTYFIAVYINPITNPGLPPITYPILISSSTGSNGFNLMYAAATPDGLGMYGASYTPRVFNGGVVTSAFYPVSGFHVFGLVCGSGSGSGDRLYIDGTEVSSYSVRGNCAGAQSSGNLYLGSSNVSPWTSSGFTGTYYRLRTYSTQLTSAQMASVSAFITSEIADRGVPVAPVPAALTSPQLFAIGDSITQGASASLPWPTQLTLNNQPAYAIHNNGIYGAAIEDLFGSEANMVAPKCKTSSGPSVAIVFAGTNSFYYGGGTTPTIVYSHLASEIATLKNAGCKVFAGTMISRGGSDGNGISYDVEKNAYDALILSQAKTSGADGIIDFAANPLVGADGANANTTYFDGDTTHPTNAGQVLLGAAASNSLNYYFGSKLANPTNVTSNTYQMLSGDGAVTTAPSANAAYTMPDCVGPSGESYTISNPQSAFAVTIVGKANQPINGLTTAITIPSNGTVTLRDVPNAKSSSGCHWVM
jgi:hypothetical protein